MKEKINFFEDKSIYIIKKIMTQICRDNTSEFFGCCDRNWWHYKIRDFPSIIMQQGIYSIYESTKIKDFLPIKNELSNLIKGGSIFWNSRAIKYGAFEEYYPFERGFPPLSFSSLAISRLLFKQIIDLKDVNKGLKISVRQILNKFEKQAVNQQIAAVATLAYLSNLNENLVSKFDFEKKLNETLSLQKKDGWFNEYGGYDLGYLSVSLDCLWDIYDITKNEICFNAIRKTTQFIQNQIYKLEKNFFAHNSRDTNYLLPYGIFRSYLNDDLKSEKLFFLINLIFNNKNFFLDVIDDRYLCHYIGVSFLRTTNFLKNKYE